MEPFPLELLAPERATPRRILDRDGRLLRETLAPDGTRGRRVPLEEISPWLVEATLVAEDRRFFEHPGVDPLAVARAAAQNVVAGRRTSGASTLTMQLVRVLRPRARTWGAKLDEALLAVRLERALGKREVLEEYLSRAPYGGNVVGAEAGARRVFGKGARDLSPGEAALLAALPQGPARLDPLRGAGLERALRRRRWVLDEMRRLGRLDAAAHARALAEAPAIRPEGAPSEAPTLCDWLLAEEARDVHRKAGPGGAAGAEHAGPRPESREGIATARGAPLAARPLRSTLDLDLQRDIEGIVRAAAPALGAAGASEAAVAVLDVATAEVLAFVGPAARRRAPGSTLKPFVYALAIDEGRLAASSPLEDRPLLIEGEGGVYGPRNYDGRFHGRVSVRQALANSLNIPSVLMLRLTGVPRALALLRGLGLEGIDPDPRAHGLGLALGDARVSPLELAGAYATLARGGIHLSPRGRLATPEAAGAALPAPFPRAPEGEGPSPSGESSGDPARSPAARLLAAETCAIVADILADDRARALSFGSGSELCLPFPVAAKTGTSVDWRDNWVAGFTARYAVAIWVGNPDGRPLRCTSGLDGAGPLFRAVALRLGEGGGSSSVRARGGPLDGIPVAFHARLVRIPACGVTGLAASAGCSVSAEELFPADRPPASCAGACSAPDAAAGADGGDGGDGLEIESPRPGDRFFLDPRAPATTRFLVVRVRAPRGRPVEVTVDGAPIATSEHAAEASRYELLWAAARGRHVVEARAGAARRRLAFTVEERR